MAAESKQVRSTVTAAPPAKPPIWNDPVWRAIFFQILVLGGVILLAIFLVKNTLFNLEKQGIASGFGFLERTAGFSIGETLIDYSEEMSYGRTFFVGLFNTIWVSCWGIVLATILGFIIGVARLSHNWLVSRIAMVYIETLRNIPLLLQIFFWYFAVLRPLPGPRDSIEVAGSFFLNNRGLSFPKPILEDGFGAFALLVLVLAIGIAFVFSYLRSRELAQIDSRAPSITASLVVVVGLFVALYFAISYFPVLVLLAGVIPAVYMSKWAGARQARTGEQYPAILVGLALMLLLPVLSFLVMGAPLHLEYPELTGFNFTGGSVLSPEFVSLLLALSTYTASFIAEIVRAGIQAVSHGQTEAAYSVGLRPGPTLRLVIIPQALRVIIPPLTSQYLNLTKNSSLAAAIAYPDLVLVFAGTALMQTGQAVEIIAMTMAVYLTLSLLISSLMNWYNKKMALVER